MSSIITPEKRIRPKLRQVYAQAPPISSILRTHGKGVRLAICDSRVLCSESIEQYNSGGDSQRIAISQAQFAVADSEVRITNRKPDPDLRFLNPDAG